MENYKQVRKVQAIIVSCMLFFVVLVGVTIMSFVSIGKTRRKNAEYDALIASLKQEQASLAENLSGINTDDDAAYSAYLEEKARYEFGMIKEDETLFIFK